MKMKTRYLLIAIICFIATEAFSQFDWKLITTSKGVEFYWKCKKETSAGEVQYCSKLKLVNTNSYKVTVMVSPTFTVNSQQYTMKPSVTSQVQANSTQEGNFQGLIWYPGGKDAETTCPSSVKLDYEVKTDETKPTSSTPSGNKTTIPPKESSPSNTFDWKYVNSANGVGFYWRCSQVSDNKYKTEIKAVNNNNYNVNVSLTPTFTVNGMNFNLGKKSFAINAGSLVAGQPDGLDFNPGNGVTCPSYIYINYTVTNSETNNPSGQQTKNQSNVSYQQKNQSEAETQESIQTYQNQQAQENERKRQEQNRERERQMQQSKENYERQLEQSQQIENARLDAYTAIENALYGTPEQRQARREREAEELRLEEEQQQQRQIERENKMREEEENRRIEEENIRIEAEQLQRRNNYYESTIPAFTMPNKYKDATLAEAYFFYIVRTNDNTISFSSLFPLRKSVDDTWPYKSDLDNKLKSEAMASEFKLVGFFPDMNVASARQQQLIQTAQEEGFTVDFFNYKYKEYKDGIQNDTQPKPKTGTDFWNK